MAENSPGDPDDQEVLLSEAKDTDTSAAGDLTAQQLEQQDVEISSDCTPVDVLQNLECGDARENDAAASANACKDMDSVEQVSFAGPFDAQVIPDTSLGWRLVMHEESGQYYYWNIETGETSWEVPEALAHISSLASDQKTLVSESTENADVGTKESSSTLGVELCNASAGLTIDGSTATKMILQSKEVLENDSQMNEWVDGNKKGTLKDEKSVTNVHQSELHSNLTAVNALSSEKSLVHDKVAGDDHERGVDLSASLVRQCECLLDRLNSLKGYEGYRQSHEQMSKHVLEVEVRLTDIRSLSSYGLSLLPFWLHSERRLKQLEEIINNEIYQLAVSAQMEDNIEATTDSSFKEKENSLENLGPESEVDAHENRKSEFSLVSTSVENDVHNEGAYRNAPDATHVPSLGPCNRHLEVESSAVVSEVNGTAHLEPELDAREDVDMDVDMEVEDEVPATITTVGDASSAQDFGLTEQMIQPSSAIEYPSMASGYALTAPPPPEEEWIPPPPPDNDQVPPPPPDTEPVPPPPPDEPPEPSYPPLPSYAETDSSLGYTDQYNLTYPDSNFQYYGHTVSVPTSSLYGHVDGSQVALSHATLYYEAVPNSYMETAPVIVSPVEPMTYYNVQDGLVPNVSAVTRTDTSELQVEAGPSELLPNVKLDGLVVCAETESVSGGFPSTAATTQASATADLRESVSAPPPDVASATSAVSVPSTAAKGRSKVLRSKKRTVAAAPSLRSNKKVSSLVDKWKAAKEELKENEEDEPESAYEILEKKRQREIEEWHAKQIASGEAKDNANFQPLGGDWRERVKRRRAQAAKEARETTPEVPKDEILQPDLAEFSTGLPSGWQAYWDDVSKQVYYGNVITSETTWTKPTK